MADPTDDHEDQPLSERFLDLFVFLPTGVAVTLAEELPRLAERGRERLGVQVNSARAIGKFAVKAGGHELKRRSEGLRKPGSAPESSPESAGPAPVTARRATPTPPPGPPRLRAIPRPPADSGPSEPPAAATAPTGPSATTSAPPTTPTTPTTPVTAPAPRSTPSSPSAAVATSPTAPTSPSANGPAPARTGGSHVPEVSSLAIPGFDTLSASQVVQRLDGLSRSELVAVRAYETSTRGRRTILSRVDQLLDERS